MSTCMRKGTLSGNISVYYTRCWNFHLQKKKNKTLVTTFRALCMKANARFTLFFPYHWIIHFFLLLNAKMHILLKLYATVYLNSWILLSFTSIVKNKQIKQQKVCVLSCQKTVCRWIIYILYIYCKVYLFFLQYGFGHIKFMAYACRDLHVKWMPVTCHTMASAKCICHMTDCSMVSTTVLRHP